MRQLGYNALLLNSHLTVDTRETRLAIWLAEAPYHNIPTTDDAIRPNSCTTDIKNSQKKTWFKSQDTKHQSVKCFISWSWILLQSAKVHIRCNISQ